MRLRCPHCNHLGTVRTTKVLSPTVSHHYLVCSNFECGHTWRATSEADMTLSPSATPDAKVSLPLASHVRRDVLAYQVRASASEPYQPQKTPPMTGDLFIPIGPEGPS